LRDRNGQPFTGVVGVTFSLYRDQQGGAPLWTENQNVQLDTQGRYTALLGATQGEGLPTELFTSGDPKWLGVQAQMPGEEEQARVFLVSVPYALKAADADTVGGKPVSAFVLAEPDAKGGSAGKKARTSSSKAGDAPTTSALMGTDTINKLAKWTD